VVDADFSAREDSPSDRRSMNVVTPAGQQRPQGQFAVHVENIDRHLMTPWNDRAALTVALSKLAGSDRSEDNGQLEPDSHQQGDCHSPCSVGR
jgi:hypothetical protein